MEIAKRLKPFGVKILATKRNWSLGSLSCGKLQWLTCLHENSQCLALSILRGCNMNKFAHDQVTT